MVFHTPPTAGSQKQLGIGEMMIDQNLRGAVRHYPICPKSGEATDWLQHYKIISSIDASGTSIELNCVE